MIKQKLSFKDSICIAQPSHKISKDLANKMLDSDREPTLRVLIDATHSGVLTNMRVYPGRKVQAGYTSYFSKDKGGSAEYDKPVLRHHNTYDDPVGRIINAKYTQLKTGQDFEMDFMRPDDTGKGSGYVTVEAAISDAETIKKIIDGRYLSVSSGHHTDVALCSVCGDNIMHCDHMPSQRYNAEGERTSSEDGTLCYIITNNMVYDELSFVNVPAQPPAKLINFNWMDCKDLRDKENILIETMSNGNKELVRALVLTDKEDEINLLTGQKKSDTKKTTIAVSDTAVADKLKAALSLPKTNDDDTNVRQISDKDKVGLPEQNLKANTQKNEDDTMDLKEYQTKVEGLERQLGDAKTELQAAIEKVKAHEATISKLNEDSVKLESKMRKSLATTLASLKVRLEKPDAQNLDNQEKLTQFIDKLAVRSLTSLEDAVSDLLVELEHSEKENKTVSNTADLIGKDKLDNVTLAKGGKPETKSKDSKTTQNSTSAVDAVLDL